MSKIFVTGDKHGDYYQLSDQLSSIPGLTKKDVVIILGDHGTLYYGARDDKHKKKLVFNLPTTFIMIRGNHDRRPSSEEYDHHIVHIDNESYCGDFYVDPNFPNILYTMEYGWYRFGSKKVFIIGGAYSVDKFKRLEMQQLGFAQYHWFADEQLNSEEQANAIALYRDTAKDVGEHYIMSHTCPQKYKPYDTFMSGINQKLVDGSMEEWLDKFEKLELYSEWYCGHWHIERSIDKMRFTYNTLRIFDDVEENTNESLSE